MITTDSLLTDVALHDKEIEERKDNCTEAFLTKYDSNVKTVILISTTGHVALAVFTATFF